MKKKQVSFLAVSAREWPGPNGYRIFTANVSVVIGSRTIQVREAYLKWTHMDTDQVVREFLEQRGYEVPRCMSDIPSHSDYVRVSRERDLHTEPSRGWGQI